METNKAMDTSKHSKNEDDQEIPIDKPEFVANSVLESEVEKFAEMSKVWWTDSFYVLQNMNKLRVPYVVEKAKETGIIRKEFVNSETPLKGLKILDVGCGGGYMTEALAKLGADVLGIDVTEEMIKLAKAHQALDETLTNLEYKYITVEEFALDHIESFDILVCSEVVQYINDPRSFILECAKCLKFGGSLIIQTISKTFWAKFFMIYLIEKVLEYAPKGIFDYEMFVTPEDLIDMMAAGGCKTTEVRGMRLNPFTKNWSWISDNQINYTTHAVKTRN